MRNVIALAGLAVMAAAVVMGDGGHPYHYETSAGWGDHHHNALVSSRQSPNPLRSRQALAALLTPGVAAAIASFAGAIGVGTIQTTAVNNRVDETNRRVSTNENDIKKSKADITTLTTNSCTKTTCDAIKTTSDNACAKTTCDTIKTTADNACLKTKCTEICNKVNDILNIGTLGDTTDDAIATFAYSESITADTDGTPNTITLGTGGTMTANAGKAAAAAFPGALLADLDSLRVAVAAAISALDQKIDSILNVPTLTC